MYKNVTHMKFFITCDTINLKLGLLNLQKNNWQENDYML